MLLCKVLLIIFVLKLPTSDSARILCLGASPSYSHQIVFRTVWEALAKNGHDLVVLTTDPWQTNQNLTNKIKQINLNGAYQFWNPKLLTDISINKAFTIWMDIFNMLNDITNYELMHPEVQQIIHNKSEHFDLFIGEVMTPVLAGFSYRFNCPYITIISMDPLSLLYRIMGNPINPVLYPDAGAPFLPPLNLIERCLSVLIQFFVHMSYDYFYLPNTEQQLKQYFLNGDNNQRIDSRELLNNISLMFLNTNPILHPNRPLTINTIQIGGGIHLTPPKPLPMDLQRFLDNSNNGVIYMSLGTNIKKNTLNEQFIEIILNTFKQLPYKILWKFDDKLEDLSNNIKTIEWAPQQDILRHVNIKLFIMQCGLQSLEEAIFYHIPIICLPFFGDQFTNSKLIERHRIGIAVDHKQIDKIDLIQIINELINNSMYKNNLKTMSELIKDQQLTGVEKAVWWSEYVIRHKGAEHLKNPINNLPFYQIYLLDVISIYLSIIVILLLIIYKSCRFIIRKLFNNTSDNNSNGTKIKTN